MKRPGSSSGPRLPWKPATENDRCELVLAPATYGIYAEAWKRFCAYSAARDRTDLPACTETVINYCLALLRSGRGSSTVKVARAAIRKVHLASGYENPCATETFRTFMAGVVRTDQPRYQTEPARASEIAPLLAWIERQGFPVLRTACDRAMILLCFLGGTPPRMLRQVRCENVVFGSDWMFIRGLRPDGRDLYVKRNRTGEFCAVAALDAWFRIAHLTHGPAFRALSGSRLRDTAISRNQIWRRIRDASNGTSLRIGGASAFRKGLTYESRTHNIPDEIIMRALDISPDRLRRIPQPWAR